MTNIGSRIKDHRTKKGLSQEELAELSKVNLRTIQRIENNETTPREKTLKLIFDALDIELIENNKFTIDKYMLWSAFLTLIIIGSTFLGWLRFTKGYLNGNKIYNVFNGWNGYTQLSDYNFHNWLVSFSSISIGLIVISHSLGLIKNKFSYILAQIIILALYWIGVFQWKHIQSFEIRPGLFLITLATIFLAFSYRKKRF